MIKTAYSFAQILDLSLRKAKAIAKAAPAVGKTVASKSKAGVSKAPSIGKAVAAKTKAVVSKTPTIGKAVTGKTKQIAGNAVNAAKNVDWKKAGPIAGGGTAAALTAYAVKKRKKPEEAE